MPLEEMDMGRFDSHDTTNDEFIAVVEEWRKVESMHGEATIEGKLHTSDMGIVNSQNAWFAEFVAIIGKYVTKEEEIVVKDCSNDCAFGVQVWKVVLEFKEDM
ncbi:hypothetical protein KI387_018616, partial [Taxus chinensis]